MCDGHGDRALSALDALWPRTKWHGPPKATTLGGLLGLGLVGHCGRGLQ
jgi:hypothetical protein